MIPFLVIKFEQKYFLILMPLLFFKFYSLLKDLKTRMYIN